jgi:hypothetical protein
VQEAYEFLTNNYAAGDCVYILGFSRGAAAARSLSGLAEIFGVLPKGLMDRLPVAWAYYNMAPGHRNLRELFRIDRDLAAIARVGEDLRRAHVGDAGTEGAESPRLRELLRGRHPQELFGPEGLTPIPASDTLGGSPEGEGRGLLRQHGSALRVLFGLSAMRRVWPSS